MKRISIHCLWQEWKTWILVLWVEKHPVSSDKREMHIGLTLWLKGLNWLRALSVAMKYCKGCWSELSSGRTSTVDKFKSVGEKFRRSYLLTYLLIYSMVQSPSWEANWFAASQEIPRISRNPKVHYRTHKRPPPVHILGQPNPVHIPTSHLLEIHPNIIHPSTPRSPQCSLSLLFPHQEPIHPLYSLIRASCPVQLILLDFITRTILGEEYKSFSFSLCNLLHSPLPRPS